MNAMIQVDLSKFSIMDFIIYMSLLKEPLYCSHINKIGITKWGTHVWVKILKSKVQIIFLWGISEI